MHSTASAPGHAPGSNSRTFWPWASMAVIVLAVCGTLYLTLTSLSHEVNQLFRPRINVTTILHATINDIRKETKLVVSSAELTPEVVKRETYRVWFLYLGTTEARVKAPGSRVQYVISLENFGVSNIEQDSEHKTIRVRFPAPRLDETLVEVNFKNLEEYKASGWSRFNKEEVAAEARGMLREATVEIGKRPWVQAQVREDARKGLEQLLWPLRASLAEGVRLEVVLEDK